MTKPEFDRLLVTHQQWFQKSCAASGMEMLLKWHQKVDPNWFEFQREFQDTNIGWGQIARLQQFGIQATAHPCDLDTFLAKFRGQSADRLLLVSLPTSGVLDLLFGRMRSVGNYHIFVAARVDGKEIFVSKSFLNSVPFFVPDLKRVFDFARQADPNYLIDTLSYELLPVA